MLVCWEWLSQYVRLLVTPDELAQRFALSGLNHECTTQVGIDTVIDLEVTSNRGDCLGHIGIAREASVLLEQPLAIPDPRPTESTQVKVSDVLQVFNRTVDGCPKYTARVIHGAKVGPSPQWLTRRLQSIGVKPVNNIVDVTNYVMFECGQPLHAFDLDLIRGKQIIVRQALAGEQFLAIDHRTYELDPQMVVIADSQRAVALGGVMGGADTEVSLRTTNLLIEAAAFDPMSIRRTARKLKLHSPSSHRFERKPDPLGLDWASRRCCELILQVAGGTLAAGSLDASCSAASEPQNKDMHQGNSQRSAIRFRLPQVARILGIEIPQQRVETILQSLGCRVAPGTDAQELAVVPPSWRADLYREIDFIEEVARIHGYDKIPEDVSVPLTLAAVRPKDIALNRIRHVLSALGIDEALTPSIVVDALDECGSLWSDRPALAIETPLLEGAKLLRRGLIASLLSARSINQSLAIRHAQFYECATVYLASNSEQSLPNEMAGLGIVTDGDLSIAKGIVEQLVSQICSPKTEFGYELVDHPMFEKGSGLRYKLGNATLGFVGLISPSVRKKLGLDDAVASAEISLDVLVANLLEVRRAEPVSAYPAVHRDLNFIIDEKIRWLELRNACFATGGNDIRSVEYRETYRDAKKDGPGKKRVLVELQFQSYQRTLTGPEVDQAITNILAQCSAQLQAKIVDQS